MKRLNKNMLLVAAVLGVTTGVANATEKPEIYGRFSLGYSSPTDLNYEGNKQKTDVALDANAQTGIAIGIQPQASFGNKIQGRYELEVAHRQFNTNGVKFSGSPGKDFDRNGNLALVTIMGNAYMDFNGVPSVQPYIGAGIGAALIDQNIKYSTTAKGSITSLNDRDNIFAAQIMAGATKKITDQLAFQTDIKYLTTIGGFESKSVLGKSKTAMKANVGEASVNFGLRYTFN